MTQIDMPVETPPPARRAVQLIDCDVHAQPTDAMLAEHMSLWARRRLIALAAARPR